MIEEFSLNHEAISKARIADFNDEIWYFFIPSSGGSHAFILAPDRKCTGHGLQAKEMPSIFRAAAPALIRPFSGFALIPITSGAVVLKTALKAV